MPNAIPIWHLYRQNHGAYWKEQSSVRLIDINRVAVAKTPATPEVNLTESED
jgi:hypothetical protein